MTLLSIAQTVLWICGLVLMVPLLILKWLVLRRLRLDHVETWKALGEPTIFWTDAPRHGRALAQFMRGGEIEQLGDPTLARLISWWRILGRFTMALFALLVVLFAFEMLR